MITEKQVKRLWAIAYNKKLSPKEVFDLLRLEFQGAVKEVELLTWQQYEQFIKTLEERSNGNST